MVIRGVPGGFSIHAPRMGCDEGLAESHQKRQSFNPRTPYGMRPALKTTEVTVTLFQSTHPVWDATAWKLTVDGQWCSSVLRQPVHRAVIFKSVVFIPMMSTCLTQGFMKTAGLPGISCEPGVGASRGKEASSALICLLAALDSSLSGTGEGVQFPFPYGVGAA